MTPDLVTFLDIASNLGTLGFMALVLWLFYTGKLIPKSVHDEARADVEKAVETVKEGVNSNFNQMTDKFDENIRVQRELIEEIKSQRRETTASREKMNLVITQMNTALNFLADWLKERQSA